MRAMRDNGNIGSQPRPVSISTTVGQTAVSSVRIPLAPPAWPKPSILPANLLAIKPHNGSDFSFVRRTHYQQSRHIILREAHSSPKLWTPQIRYGSRNFNVSKDL